MPDYKKMYFKLAGKVVTTIESLMAAQETDEKACIEDHASTIIPICEQKGTQKDQDK